MIESLVDRLRHTATDPSRIFTDSRRALVGTASHLLELQQRQIADCQKDFDELTFEVERRNSALRAIAAHLSLADDTPMQVLVDTALKMIELGLQKHLDDHSPPDRG